MTSFATIKNAVSALTLATSLFVGSTARPAQNEQNSGGQEPTANDTEKNAKDIEKEALDIIDQRCAYCHNSQNQSGEVILSDKQGIAAHFRSHGGEVPAAIQEIDQLKMPKDSELSVEERKTLHNYAKLLADERHNQERTNVRPRVTQAEIYAETEALLKSLPTDLDRRYVRVLSLATQHNNPTYSKTQMQEHVEGVVMTLNLLSHNPEVIGMPDSEAKHKVRLLGSGDTVHGVAFDIRDLSDPHWGYHRSVEHMEHLINKVFLFDPLRALPSEAQQNYFLAATHNQVPVANADFFTLVALQPPFYHDLQDIPRTVSEFYHQEGILFERQTPPYFAGVKVSGVSEGPRIMGFYRSLSNNIMTISYDSAADLRFADLPVPDANRLFGFERYYRYWNEVFAQNGRNFDKYQPSPVGGGELIHYKPNGYPKYMLINGNEARINAGPASLVTDPEMPNHAGRQVINGISCFRCHNGGMNSFKEQVMDLVKQNPRFSEQEKEAIGSLYLDNEELKRALTNTEDPYLKALERANIRRLDENQVYNLVAPLIKPLTAQYVEAATGVPKAGISKAFRSNPDFVNVLGSGNLFARDLGVNLALLNDSQNTSNGFRYLPGGDIQGLLTSGGTGEKLNIVGLSGIDYNKERFQDCMIIASEAASFLTVVEFRDEDPNAQAHVVAHSNFHTWGNGGSFRTTFLSDLLHRQPELGVRYQIIASDKRITEEDIFDNNLAARVNFKRGY